MMKPFMLILSAISIATLADAQVQVEVDAGPCAGVHELLAKSACERQQYDLRRQQAQQQQEQQQAQRQAQDDQARQRQLLQEQQVENLRLQNEILRRKLEQEKSGTSLPVEQTPLRSISEIPEFQEWKLDNPWFGVDHAKSEFAMLFARQLRQDQPELTGRPFLNAVSAEVGETFGSGK
jgi:hypothetical protein